MKISKNIETEVLKVYEIWLDSYLNGDVETYDSFFDDDYHFIGSTNNEEFLSRKNTTKFFSDTAEQLAGKCDLRNESRIIEQFGELVFITHFFDAWFRNGTDYSYYGRFRFTNTLRKNKEGWRFIYQHFSTPDSNTDEGETIGFDKISEDNKELREAIKRGTIELSHKNRELEIEATLERVRARSLAMQSSDELLETSDVMLAEITKLNIHAVQIGICTINAKTEAAEIWSRSETNKRVDDKILGVVPKGVSLVFDKMVKCWKQKKPFYTNTRKGKEVADYYKKVAEYLSYPLPEKYNKQETLSSFFFPEGALNVISLLPLDEEENGIMLRFAKVFGQVYRRFLDLQKAEAQTREAEIELALERVRAKTIAMKHSDELQETSHLLDQQVRSLGIETWGCAFNIYREKDSIEWFGNEKGVLPTYIVPREGIFKEYYEYGQAGKSIHVQEFVGEKCIAHYEYMSSLPVIGDVLRTLKENNGSYPGYQIDHVVFFKYGYLLFITVEHVPESHDIFKRFANVFEQTYTRFLDLQKAEAQAREAQIEAALERVRARSMAMHKSEELTEAGALLYSELSNLGIQNLATGYNLFDETETISWSYGVNPLDGSIRHKPVGMYHTQTPVMKAIFESWKKQEPVFVVQLNPEETIEHQIYMAEESIDFPISKEELLAISPERLVVHTFNFKQGYLLIVGGDLLTVEQQEMVSRFSGVFQQTYTRFLDLKKAEKQAREAEVDLALERVRSQAMAMQKSSDLLDIVVSMRTEFTRLGHEAHYFWHMMWLPEKYEKAMTSGDGTKIGFVMELPRHMHGDIPLLDRWEKSEEPTVVYAMDTDAAIDYIDKMVSLGDFKNIDPQAPTSDDIRHIGGLTFVMARTTHGEIGYSLPGVVENPPKEDLDILVRFAGAFDIAHRRFLDLQTSEAQAREVEIELALEKVRSRSMGMQKSEELKEVIQEVYDQFVQLKVNVEHTGFILDYKQRDDMFIWLADKHKVPAQITIPYFDSPHWNSFVEAKATGKSLFTNLLAFEEKNKFYKELFELVPGVDAETSAYYLSSPGLAISTVLLENVALYIENFTAIPFNDDENALLMRFGKVFQQTYTRFLDLEKAEAQAREAQIEASLERVRSRSMAMHRSEEMLSVIEVVSEQLTELNLNFDTVSFGQNNREGDFKFWLTSSGQPTPILLQVPKIDSPVINTVREAQKKEIHFIENVFTPAENREWSEHLFAHTELKYFPQGVKNFMLNSPGFARSSFLLKNIDMYVGNYRAVPYTENENAVLQRFAQVFEQSYTRFLDLEKAEAQARKAQIETSLERVRARAMSMHDSNELDDVLMVLCEQFDVLGIVPMSTHMTVFDFENNTFTFRETGKFGNRSFGEQTVALDAMDNWKETVDKWKADEATAINKLHFPKEQLPEVWKVFHESFASMPEGSRITPDDYPDGIYHTAGKHPYGYIGMNQIRPATDEEEQIVIKFANEFGMAYQRFLDLQKAEAQTREAQIEAALERVRSVALSLNKSEDMLDIARVLYEQLLHLGFTNIRNALIDIHNEKSESFTDYDYSELMGGTVTQMTYEDDPTLKEQVQDIATTTDGYSEMVLEGEQLQDLIDMRRKNGEADDPRLLAATNVSYILYAFGNGAIGISNFGKLDENQKAILSRFRNVFTFAYNRYTELSKAESQMREVQLEASLEKVRSAALGMQKPDDMLEIAQALYEQLRDLGFTDIRNTIIDLHNEDDETFWDYDYSEAMSGSITLLSYKNDPTLEKQYRKIISTTNGFYEEIFEGEALKEYVEMRIRNGEKDDPRLRNVDLLSYYLYSFGNGVIGISNFSVLNEDQKEIVGRFRNVFTFAYKRYTDLLQSEKDLVKLQEAKRAAENAFTELKDAQKQLIQSEKMASLGELTAGIAHEIQNPLNFVNNFSEVSNELIEEIEQEIEKGDLEEAKAILVDIKGNLEKINHHGKRADSIVKGMLEHSRSSKGKKEPTDINALADEYLRLSYHGLRAKDKSFQSDFKTDFDENLGKINVIPQDIGRVLLNLFNNAFYACAERSRSACAERSAALSSPKGRSAVNQLSAKDLSGFENPKGLEAFKPTVSVHTKKVADKIEIRVSDNGNGIPKEIVDKIFQPFFTTKPTGQGTGLGLSLSYDIVKAHGGVLEVETRVDGGNPDTIGKSEGMPAGQAGTTFTIKIPL